MWSFICSMFTETDAPPEAVDMTMAIINPATGMPMMGDGIGGVDVGGSPFGMDVHASPKDFGDGTGSNPWD